MDVRMGLMADDFEVPIDASALTGFQTLRSVDTSDNVGTTMLEGMAATIHAKIDSALGLKPTYHYFTAARGGTSLAGINQGTVPYQNLLIGVQRAHDIAASMGKHYYVAAIAWVHGESDTGNSSYASQFMSTFYNPVNAAIKAITGQLNDVQVFAVQPSSFQTFTGVLQLRAIEDLTPNYHLVAPTFCMPFSATDYLHQNRRGQFGNGENLGLAYLDVCAGLRTWEPLEPTSIAFNGTTGVTITFNVPEGALTLDPTATDKDGNWGFELYTGSTKIDIADKQIVGNSVVLTAASNLTTGTSVVRYALNGQTNPRTEAAIPRGRLRDGRSIVSPVDGRLLYNWCVHFQETI